jgi:hypothetical protein
METKEPLRLPDDNLLKLRSGKKKLLSHKQDEQTNKEFIE